MWEEVEGWLQAAPERTAKAMFQELQERYPGRFPDSQLRTLQRRVKEWREGALVQFDAHWVEEDLLAGAALPPRLHACLDPEQGAEREAQAAAVSA